MSPVGRAQSSTRVAPPRGVAHVVDPDQRQPGHVGGRRRHDRPLGTRAAAPRRAGAASAAPDGPRRRGRPRRARRCRRDRHGRARRWRRRAATARSAPGSTTRTPPATLAYTSRCPDRRRARRRCEHREQHREPVAVDRLRDAARHRRGRVDDERLHLDAQRPGALEHRRDDRARTAGRRSARNSALGSATGCSPSARISMSPSSSVEPNRCFSAREHAQRVVAVAFERQDGVDDVLEHARAGQRAVLGDVADEQRRDAGVLGQPHQPLRGVAHLRDRSGRAGRVGIVHGLDRVDREDVGCAASSTCAHTAGSDVSATRNSAGSSVPSRSARSRTCAGDSSALTSRHRAPVGGHRAERLEQQRALAHAGLAADQRDRARRPGPRRAPGRARQTPVGRRRGADAGRSRRAAPGRSARTGPSGAARDRRLAEAAPLAAVGAAAEPLRRS